MPAEVDGHRPVVRDQEVRERVMLAVGAGTVQQQQQHRAAGTAVVAHADPYRTTDMRALSLLDHHGSL